MTLVKMEEAQEREAIVKTHEGEEKEARKKKGGEGGRGGGWHITCSDGSEIYFWRSFKIMVKRLITTLS